ncbi:MAG: hypothetical protein DWQ04_28300 [Chloroflexi bacterium]|nr:MAG: hypothetical protein DWQ04_28300 [Chloroflexota bacterium]
MIWSNMIENGRLAQSGAIAGAASAFAFAVIHDIFISDIWFSLLIMMAAGAICGLCVSWSFRRLIAEPSLKSWLVYNLLYDGMFVLLGVVSVLFFEPVTTMAALVAANGPPNALILQALPVTAVFTLGMAIGITLLYSGHHTRRSACFGAVLLTCFALMLLLGLNVSVIGLVKIPYGSLYLIIEMFVLIFLINAVYVVVFLILNALPLQLIR